MPDEEWMRANADQKLELLRKDIKDIATAQNGLARDFRDLLRRLEELLRSAVASEQSHQQNEAAEPTSQQENHQEPSSTSHSDA